MGLSVSVYQNIKLSKNEDDHDFIAYVIDPNWKHKVKNLEYDCSYIGDICNCGISYTYGTHNRFRENLIKLIGRNDLLLNDSTIDWGKLEEEKEITFYDFIDFADNEGCLDWGVNAKLYEDFKNWHGKAMDFGKDVFYFNDYYNEWLEIFNQGKKENSVIVFH